MNWGPSSDDPFHQLVKGLTSERSWQQTKYKNLEKSEFIQLLQSKKVILNLEVWNLIQCDTSTATEFQSDPWQKYDINRNMI